MRRDELEFAIANLDYREIWRYTKKRNQFLIRDDGRWGPTWLHRLVLRVATNLGMVGHPVDVGCSLRKYQIRAKSIEGRLIKGASIQLDMGYRLDQIEAIVGQDAYPEIVRLVRDQLYLTADIRRCENGIMYQGLDIRIVPGVSGVAVIPKSGARR